MLNHTRFTFKLSSLRRSFSFTIIPGLKFWGRSVFCARGGAAKRG